jgi:glycosyltransferase involved in cell wall biosynthesis
VISAVIAVRDHGEFVAAAVASALGQTLAPAEVIVVDDGSTDDSAARAEAAGARVLRGPHRGVGHALNRGIAASTQPLVAFLDADDLWVPDKLERQREALGEHDAVFGWVQEFSDLAVRCRTGPALLKATMLIRREALQRVGPFDEDLIRGDFVEWFARARDGGDFAYAMLDRIVLRRRIHAANLARHRAPDHGDYLRILKASLDRRRA